MAISPFNSPSSSGGMASIVEAGHHRAAQCAYASRLAPAATRGRAGSTVTPRPEPAATASATSSPNTAHTQFCADATSSSTATGTVWSASTLHDRCPPSTSSTATWMPAASSRTLGASSGAMTHTPSGARSIRTVPGVNSPSIREHPPHPSAELHRAPA
ncbi:conserved hypothetical protein [Rhodococcus jostii RHA1]|uniref:Uncharacterized protein n=1 Tax=Rhodococcus jostii (strain RHA1) TaxID=101510 RepID=Q0SBL1_RHOJR|nr:conserved hypothetical protein [Rhodococcus jostii RHA1]